MGKKYIVEKDDNESIWSIYADANGDAAIEGVSLTPYTEPDLEQIRKEAYEQGINDANYAIADDSYKKGLSDAWEAARKIYLPEDHGGLGYDMRMKIFNTDNMGWLFKNLSASEAIEKIRQYEQEKEMDGLRQNIQTIVDQCGYSLDEIAEVLQKMKES